MLSPRLGARLALALGAAAISFGGVSAAAYAGVLPAGLQDLAHTTVGAPAADYGKSADHRKPADSKNNHRKPADSNNKSAVGPDARGHAAFGLCTASLHVLASGKVADKSVAFTNLTAAAGGEGGISAYCATIPHPGTSLTGKSASSSAGRSATHPSAKPATATGSKGKLGANLTGKPRSVPGGYANGSAAVQHPDRGATRRG